jgi:hypothetical protein
MKSKDTVFWDITYIDRWKPSKVLEEYIASIFMVERKPSKVQAWKQGLVEFQQTTRHSIPEDITLHNCSCENLKSSINNKLLLSLKSTFCVVPLVSFPKISCMQFSSRLLTWILKFYRNLYSSFPENYCFVSWNPIWTPSFYEPGCSMTNRIVKGFGYQNSYHDLGFVKGNKAVSRENYAPCRGSYTGSRKQISRFPQRACYKHPSAAWFDFMLLLLLRNLFFSVRVHSIEFTRYKLNPTTWRNSMLHIPLRLFLILL